ncbi:anthranilate synthase family protein [Streptomyces albireticuli]|uniref:anthranilate synthase n=1 Tax=Streptomyces albireticuli TaxID=1940 RepID=A0A2A2DBK9_9ACTN|nr:anthranilate synthase family protein [Streptomyces albireticuli]MCD9145506.1 anthranilate synthase family protein [Streptomyces albireticuli]MCD9165205.1 anthranilate synthase family protein [Streptomyces albireticuli]MCD9195734.1 anthranilate synthase family protein [Streptomyces albireticuli]PAU49858.1 phenazine-specific anthranilate synthase component I [Streptomyces albireticuli]
MSTGTGDLLGRILGGDVPAYALVHRPEATGPGAMDVLAGEVSAPASLADVRLPAPGGAGHEALVVVPYRQIAERGYACADDGAPLLAVNITDQAVLPVAEVLGRIPETRIPLSGGTFDVPDEAYADIVRRVIAEEIGTGEGANFVIKRSFTAEITGYGPEHALTFFRRLMERESGAYWTFLVHTGDRTFVGATPERHISVRDGVAVMNPISGTYRYPAAGPNLPEVMDFLADRKEADELYMVVDEELKMMARICAGGGRVVGPYLKEMARLAHTEYFIEGRTGRDPREILRETLFAPTVTGSPLESAARVIDRYEPLGRGYYSGLVALIGQGRAGTRELDSAILIRTADIDRDGRVRIGVGATLVRHSDPDSEVLETRAKAAGLISALKDDGGGRFGRHPRVRAALEERNSAIADFWLAGPDARARTRPVLEGRRVLVVDAEDTFTSMIDHQLRSLGLEVTVRRFDEPHSFDGHDLIVMGPGPGDPRAATHPKIAHLDAAIATLLDEGRPFLAVCLSHQVLSLRLGLELHRREVPNQGVQRGIDLFGSPERVGFYNTFTARSTTDTVPYGTTGTVEISRDPATGEVHALRGPHFASVQFHAESVLTQDGPRIVGNLLAGLVGKVPVA